MSQLGISSLKVIRQRLYVVQWVSYYSNRLGKRYPKQTGLFQKSSNNPSEAESVVFSAFQGRMFWKAQAK